MFNYGAEVFYNNTNGNVVFIEGPCMSTLDMEGIRPTCSTIASRFGILETEISSAVVEKEIYESIYSENGMLIIKVVDGEVVISERDVSISYNSQKVRHSYSSEEIQGFMEHYLFNLANVIRNSEIFNLDFIDPVDIKILPQKTRLAWNNYLDNPYIVDAFKDRSSIATNILEIGMFWPLVVADMDIETQPVLFEGGHRAMSIQLYNQINGWPEGRKLLAIRSKNLWYDHLLMRTDNNVRYLPSTVRVRAPYIVKYYDLGYEAIDTEELDAYFKLRNVKFVDEDREIVEYDIYTYAELYASTQTFPKWLRDMIHSSKDICDPVLPLDCLNDEASFQEWRLSCLEI